MGFIRAQKRIKKYNHMVHIHEWGQVSGGQRLKLQRYGIIIIASQMSCGRVG